MEENLIHTKDLTLYTVEAAEYELLEADYAHPNLWLDRGFSDPHKYFLNNRNPIPYRINQVRKDPKAAKYLLRVAVLRESMEIIGSAGFHNLPDVNGMIEIGFGIDHTFRNKGYGKQILHGMWNWVVKEQGVKTLRYTVSPSNLISQQIIQKLQFNLVGEQLDDVDGVEEIYELSSSDYKLRFTDISS
jgi:ribosomal-protein-alanine N-acetyltransferase